MHPALWTGSVEDSIDVDAVIALADDVELPDAGVRVDLERDALGHRDHQFAAPTLASRDVVPAGSSTVRRSSSSEPTPSS